MPEVAPEVVAEHGRWTVYLLVLTAEGVERRRLASYPTESLARTSAATLARTVCRRRPPREAAGD